MLETRSRPEDRQFRSDSKLVFRVVRHPEALVWLCGLLLALVRSHRRIVILLSEFVPKCSWLDDHPMLGLARSDAFNLENATSLWLFAF